MLKGMRVIFQKGDAIPVVYITGLVMVMTTLRFGWFLGLFLSFCVFSMTLSLAVTTYYRGYYRATKEVMGSQLKSSIRDEGSATLKSSYPFYN